MLHVKCRKCSVFFKYVYIHIFMFVLLRHIQLFSSSLGIGNCLASTPFVVVLGFYFHERRSMVIAISQAVIGIGFFLASPLAFVMLNRLGLHGTFLILGCINAQLCVIAVICKPSSVEERILNKTYISEGRNYNDNEGHYLDQLSLNTLESVITNQEIVIEDKETFSPNLTDVEIDKRISYTEDDDSYLLNTNEWYTSQTDDDKFDVTMSDILLDKQERNTDNVMEGANNEFYISQTEDKCRTSVCNGLHNKPERKVTNVDICENDSANIDELNTSKPNVNNLDHKQFRVGIMVFKIANRIINLHLLTNVPFVLFILSTLSWNFTLSVCIMHLPNYMKVKGATDMAVSAIMTCFSASNLLGRFLGKLYIVFVFLIRCFLLLQMFVGVIVLKCSVKRPFLFHIHLAETEGARRLTLIMSLLLCSC